MDIIEYNPDEKIIYFNLIKQSEKENMCKKKKGVKKNKKKCKYIYVEPKINENDEILKKVIYNTNKTITNKIKAESEFKKPYFAYLTIEDQANSSMIFGFNIPDFFNIMATYLLPTYINAMENITLGQRKEILNFVENTNINLNKISPDLNNFFNIKQFLLNMEENFFDTPPVQPYFYNSEKNPELYVYSIYYNELETNNELFLDTGYKGHAISSIIKKKSDNEYYVSIIDTGDGEFTKLKQVAITQIKGNFNIESRGIITFKITEKSRILKYIYFFSNYFNFIKKLQNTISNQNFFIENQYDYYGKIVTMLFTDKNGNLIDKNGKQIESVNADNTNICLDYFAVDMIDEGDWTSLPIQNVSNCYIRACIYSILWKMNNYNYQSHDKTSTLKTFNKWYKKISLYETIKSLYLIFKYNLSDLSYQNIFNELMITYNKKLYLVAEKNTQKYVLELQKKINLQFTRFLSGIEKENFIYENSNLELKCDYEQIKYNDKKSSVVSDILKFSEKIDMSNVNDSIINFVSKLSGHIETILTNTTKDKITSSNLHVLGTYYILNIEHNIEKLYDTIFNLSYTGHSPIDLSIYTYLSQIIEKYSDLRCRVPIYAVQFDQSPLYCLAILQIIGKLLNKPSTSVDLSKSLLIERISCAVPLHKKQKEFYDKLCQNINFSYDFLMLNNIDVDPKSPYLFEEILYQKSFIFNQSKYISDEYERLNNILYDKTNPIFIINPNGDPQLQHGKLIMNDTDFEPNDNLTPTTMATFDEINDFFKQTDNDILTKTTKDFTNFFTSTHEIGDKLKKIITIKRFIRKIYGITQSKQLDNLLKIIYICNLPKIPPIGFMENNNSVNNYLDKNNIFYKNSSIIIFNNYSVLYFTYHLSYIRSDNIRIKKNDVFKRFNDKNKLFVASSGKILQEIEKLSQKSEFDKNYEINYVTLCENCKSYGSNIFKNSAGEITTITPFMPDNINVTQDDFKRLKDVYDNFKKKINEERKFMISYLYNMNTDTSDTIDAELPFLKNCIFHNKIIDNFEEKNINYSMKFNLNSNLNDLIEKIKDIPNLDFTRKIDEFESYYEINDLNEDFISSIMTLNNYNNFNITTFNTENICHSITQIFEYKDNVDSAKKFIKFVDFVSTNFLISRMFWYKTFTLLMLSRKMTTDFYLNPDNYYKKLNLSFDKPIITKAKYNKLLDPTKVYKDIDFIPHKYIKPTTKNKSNIINNFINNVFTIKIDNYDDINNNHKFNFYDINSNTIIKLDDFIINNDNKIIIYKANNKILYEEERIFDDKKPLIRYKLYKYNLKYSKFEFISEHINELSPILFNKYIVENNFYYETSERCEVPHCLNEYYFWKIKSDIDDYKGELIDNDIRPIFIPNSIKELNKTKKGVFFQDNAKNYEILDIYTLFKKYDGYIIEFAYNLSNSFDLNKLCIIKEDMTNNYNIYVNDYKINNKPLQFNLQNDKIYLNNDKQMEIILDNKDADYNISRFYRFVAGLDGVYLIKNNDKFKILFFPDLKIKKEESDFIINIYDYVENVGWNYSPNYWDVNKKVWGDNNKHSLIKFKFFTQNNNLTNINLFDLHESGIYITNVNRDTLLHFIKLINIYLLQDKFDIGRQLMNQLYNFIYTLPLIEKLHILFIYNNELKILLNYEWNYSLVLIDKIKILSLWIDYIDLNLPNTNNLKNIEIYKFNLINKKIDEDLLNKEIIYYYVKQTFNLHLLNEKNSYYKLNFILKNNFILPKILSNIKLTFDLRQSHILTNTDDGEGSVYISKVQKKLNKNMDYSFYKIIDVLLKNDETYNMLFTQMTDVKPNTEHFFAFNLKFSHKNRANKIKLIKLPNIIYNIVIPIQKETNWLNKNVITQIGKYQKLFYKKLINKFLLIEIDEITKNITKKQNTDITTYKKELNQFIKGTSYDQMNDFYNEDKDYVENEINLSLNGQSDNDININDELIEKIEKYLNTLIYTYCYEDNDCYETKLEYNNNILNSIYNHISELSKLGIKFITSFLFLQRIKSIKMGTYKIKDIYENITIELLNDNIEMIIILYEFMNGYFLRKEQINYIKSILSNFKSNESRIYQIGMGLGKTSVLGPLISILYSIQENKNIINIMPAHLIKQAENKYIESLSPFYPVNIRLIDNYSKSYNPFKQDMDDTNNFIYIMSDKTAKVIYLNSKINKIKEQYYNSYDSKYFVDEIHIKKILDKSVTLIDEIDSLSDSRKSELNYPDDDRKIPTEINFRINHIIFIVNSLLEITTKDLISAPEDIKIIKDDIIVYNYSDSVKNILLNAFNKNIDDFKLLNNNTDVDLKELINNGKITTLLNNEQKYILKHLYHDNLPTCLKQIYNVHFGLKMDNLLNDSIKYNDPTFNLLAVPYEYAGKPSAESKFSDIDLTLFYTYYSFRKIKTLRDVDISKIIDIYKNKHTFESRIINDLDTSALQIINRYFNTTLELATFNSFTQTVTEYNKLKNILSESTYNKLKENLILNKEFITKYLFELIIEPTNLSSDFNDNISFIDIITSNFTKTRVAFTGTPSKLIPIDIDDKNDFHFGIEKQGYIRQEGAYKEYLDSTLCIHPKQKGYSDKINIYVYDPEKIDKILENILRNESQNYDCLIDVGAIFKSFSTSEVAIKINTIPKYNSKKIVYMDLINKRDKYVENNTIYDYNENNIGNFIYYDNSNIVGKDLKQAPTARGIITIGNSTFTDFSQGLYRLRKLKEGQRADFLIPFDIFKKINNNITINPLLSNDYANYKTDSNYHKILVNICNHLIKQELDLDNKNTFNFYLQNARVLYRNNLNSKSLNPNFDDSLNTHLYKTRGFINNIIDVNNEKYIKTNPTYNFTYENILGNYYLNIIKAINTILKNKEIDLCITNMEGTHTSSDSVATNESLSISQSMQINMSQSLLESQYSKNIGSPNIEFKYYLTKADLKHNNICSLNGSPFYETSYRSNNLAEKMSVMTISLYDNTDNSIYLSTNQTTNLLDSSVSKILITGTILSSSTPLTINFIGYIKLKNGKLPYTFKENMELLTDFEHYDTSMLGTTIKVKDDIFSLLQNNETDIRVLPFKNIIINTNTINTQDYEINLLPGGDYLYNSTGNIDIAKLTNYISELNKKSTDNLIKLLKYITYVKDGTHFKITSIFTFNIDNPDKLMIGGNFYKMKYLKYKQKYLNLCKIISK